MRAQPYRSQRSDTTVDGAVSRHGRNPDATLPVLRDVQAANHDSLGKPVLGALADALRVNDARVYGVGSFYSLFSTQPRAEKVLRVCDGPVCILRGAECVAASIQAGAAGGEWAVERCSCLGLCDRAPAATLDAVDRSRLRGCGGAGFPTGRKWRMVAQAPGPEKYVVCNADESEPGTFKDRVLMQGDSHLLLEGMALAGYAVGASEGIIYIRGEYEWIARRLEHAITEAEERGWLGRDIRGSGFGFRVCVHRGAGAYICGEETALLESLEGKRGEPRVRPPYPTTHGYHGQPTLINNVATLCLVPPIVIRGADWFRSLGTTDSPGTKVFTVTACVKRPGAFEAPLGITLREVIEQFGGGRRGGSRFKAALSGGAAGLCVPASLLDVPIDFSSGKQGVALGSGAMLILDESVHVPTLLAWLLHFFEVESCGKCTPCREGTREVRLICERIARGEARPEDVAELRRLAHLMNLTSLCGLGQSVAWPLESALRHFGEEFDRSRTPRTI